MIQARMALEYKVNKIAYIKQAFLFMFVNSYLRISTRTNGVTYNTNITYNINITDIYVLALLYKTKFYFQKLVLLTVVTILNSTYFIHNTYTKQCTKSNIT